MRCVKKNMVDNAFYKLCLASTCTPNKLHAAFVCERRQHNLCGPVDVKSFGDCTQYFKIATYVERWIITYVERWL